jgi:hypothetical protein
MLAPADALPPVVPGNNCTTGAQRFLAALSNREQSTSNVDAR